MSDKLPPKILIIESEETLSATLCNAVERSWFDVLKAYTADQALKIATTLLPNVAVISSRLKDASALEMASRIRKNGTLLKLPIIFLLDEGELSSNYNQINNDLVELLYRPFTPNQLMMSIRTLLRKSQPIFQDKVIKYKDVSLDLSTYKVYRGNKNIYLGPTEFKILQLFVQSPKVIFSRQHIIDYVWGVRKAIEPRTVDVHINRLRTLMKTNEKDQPFIKTVRASGYCINLPGEID